jgi:hypothetical protein
MDQTKHDKLKMLFKEVLLNYQAQQQWQENVDPDFPECVDVMIKKYDQQIPKEQWFRTGVMLGAVYEQWRQRLRSAMGMVEFLADMVSNFMETVPGDPAEGEREWSASDMASYLIKRLDDAGCVRLAAEQEMPYVTAKLAELALELVSEGADVFTAGAGAMWTAIQQNGFRKVVTIKDVNL